MFMAAIAFQIAAFDTYSIASVAVKLTQVQTVPLFEYFNALIKYPRDGFMLNPLLPFFPDSAIMDFWFAIRALVNWQHLPLFPCIQDMKDVMKYLP